MALTIYRDALLAIVVSAAVMAGSASLF
jgi:hypothetical protein